VGKHVMINFDKKIVVGVKGSVVELLVVVLFVVVGSQTAVDGLSSDPRCLAVGC
jgi:hypothetical protein